jgi:hypothetical protein
MGEGGKMIRPADMHRDDLLGHLQTKKPMTIPWRAILASLIVAFIVVVLW